MIAEATPRHDVPDRAHALADMLAPPVALADGVGYVDHDGVAWRLREADCRDVPGALAQSCLLFTSAMA